MKSSHNPGAGDIIPIVERRPDGLIETIAADDPMVGGEAANYFHNGVAALG